MTLKSDLDAFRDAFMHKVPPEIRAAMTAADIDLAASGVVRNALTAGDQAPDFALADARGGTVRLADLLADGPVVLSFYRGGWCPYCNLELRAFQQALPELTALGASLVAISPETPDDTVSTADKNALAFPVLSDSGNAVARQFGIVFDLAPALRPIYSRLGHGLDVKNGDDSWTLPMPATFVIDRDGSIALAFVDSDYRSRLEPADVIATIANLNRRRAA